MFPPRLGEGMTSCPPSCGCSSKYCQETLIAPRNTNTKVWPKLLETWKNIFHHFCHQRFGLPF